MAGLQPDGPRRALARGAALVGRLESVVEGIADQVIERRLEPVEDVAIDARGLADDLELRLLAELPGRRRGPGAGSRGCRRPAAASGW